MLFVWIHRHFRSNKALNVSRSHKKLWSIISVITFSGLTFLYYGPSLTRLSEFSHLSLLNQASMNGVYTFIKSWQQSYRYREQIPEYHFAPEPLAIRLSGIVPLTQATLLFRIISKPEGIEGRNVASCEKNIVVLIMESFGARHIGCMNHGQGITPNFDRIAKEGMLFTRFKSNGPRSHHGLVSIVSGFPAILGVNLQRRKELYEFQTIGNILLTLGYSTRFIHSGHASFDEMDKFMKQGGFQEIFDINDFKTWRCKNDWCVTDEDLYDQALQMIWSKNDKPALSVIFTLSNHPPYEILRSFERLILKSIP